MKKHVNFPSIEQFKNAIAAINRTFHFVGLDDTGAPIMDESRPKPVITFKGTVKLHGTNAAICFSNAGGLWAQSRENIVTIEKDNAGFAFFVENNKDACLSLIKQVQEKENVDLDKNIISIFGEWAGKSIQQNVGIENIEKAFFIFGVKISPIVNSVSEEDKLNKREAAAFWVDYSYLDSPANRIYNINNFENYSMDIDFNAPQLKQNDLIALTEKVEAQCPVAKAFGHEGIGEGIVWVGECNGFRITFKVKGEKHSSTKTKTLAPVDTEKISSIAEFVNSVVTESRFNQALENVFPNNEPLDLKKTGDVLRWIVNDVLKEELDTMQANNLEPKDVNGPISAKARQMFLARVNKV